MDEEILSNPSIADSLMVATLPAPKDALPERIKFAMCLNDVIFPDNVGSLIQSASAIGDVDAIIGTQLTCDFYGWKVLEASKGEGFSIPKNRMANMKELRDIIQKHNLLPLVGRSDEGVEISSVDMSKHSGVMVVIGNEKHGANKDILDMAVPVKIPIKIHSLNASVAGGILLQLAKSCMR
jgi:tRNA G18 (ribose-2'-O)-methylase SpoU